MLLTPQVVSVDCAGEVVVLQLGSVRRSLEFDVALKLATWMKHNAWLAKLNTLGEDAREGRFSVGVLHDANAPKAKRKRFAEKLPELLRPHGLHCGVNGQLVTLTIERSIVNLPWSTARKLSQWLRVRGKEAKHNSGERAHWSKLVKPEAIRFGERPW